ncbi:hypothetical protein MTO96_037648 [Rhipicephalus appendiculatus]
MAASVNDSFFSKQKGSSRNLAPSGNGLGGGVESYCPTLISPKEWKRRRHKASTFLTLTPRTVEVAPDLTPANDVAVRFVDLELAGPDLFDFISLSTRPELVVWCYEINAFMH